MRGEEAAAAGWGCSAPGERGEQEMLRLQEKLALIPLVSFFTLTLIGREDDTWRVGAIFVGFISHTMPWPT